MSLSRVAFALLSTPLLAACATTSSAPAGATRLPRARTSFVRFAGQGRLPPPGASVTYELCVDVAAATLVSVRAPGQAAQSEEPLANALRGWTWRVDASLPLKQGAGCWMERFAPGTGADGKATVTMETAVPLRSLRLVGDSDDIDDVGAAAPGEDVVRAMRVLDGGPLRVVLLEPSLTLLPPSPPPVAAKVVHDTDDAPCCRARPAAASTPAPPPSHPDGWLPHLPDLYRVTHKPETSRAIYEICIDSAGQVERVRADVPLLGANESIVHVLKTRRYPPPPAPRCGSETISFTIE